MYVVFKLKTVSQSLLCSTFSCPYCWLIRYGTTSGTSRPPTKKGHIVTDWALFSVSSHRVPVELTRSKSLRNCRKSRSPALQKTVLKNNTPTPTGSQQLHSARAARHCSSVGV
ncbi:unnamed protein product [Pylaiella littoralis]